MALPDWILGVLFRPRETFERSNTEMTFSYWWILLSVFTLEAVLVIYDPEVRQMVPKPPTGDLIFNWMLFLLTIFTVQSFCLLGAARLFHWPISWPDAMKYTGLTWALYLVEDMVTFYPFLKQQYLLLFWVSIPFILWRIGLLAVGVKRVTGRSLGAALLIALLATLPWQAPLFYLSWVSTFHNVM